MTIMVSESMTFNQLLQATELSPQRSSQRPCSTKVFIQMSGAPGSGKSTTAILLGPRIEASIIPHDLIKSIILDHDMDFDQASKLTYDLDWTLAEDAMRQGRSVIIDSVCNYKETIDRGRALARKYNFTYWYIEVRVDVGRLAILDDRLKNRVSLKAQRTSVDQHPLGTESDTEHMRQDARAKFEKWILQPCRPERNIIVVDAEGALDERVEYIVQQLSNEDVDCELLANSHR